MYIAVSIVCDVGLELDSIHKLLTSVGVLRLTECLRIVPQTELYKLCPALQTYVRQLVPWIQKQLYTEFTETYNFLVSSSIKSRLAVMRFVEVSRHMCTFIVGISCSLLVESVGFVNMLMTFTDTCQ